MIKIENIEDELLKGNVKIRVNNADEYDTVKQFFNREHHLNCFVMSINIYPLNFYVKNGELTYDESKGGARNVDYYQASDIDFTCTGIFKKFIKSDVYILTENKNELIRLLYGFKLSEYFKDKHIVDIRNNNNNPCALIRYFNDEIYIYDFYSTVETTLNLIRFRNVSFLNLYLEYELKMLEDVAQNKLNSLVMTNELDRIKDIDAFKFLINVNIDLNSEKIIKCLTTRHYYEKDNLVKIMFKDKLYFGQIISCSRISDINIDEEYGIIL